MEDTMNWFTKLIELIADLFNKKKKDEEPPEEDKLPDAIDWKDITWLGVNVGGWDKKYKLRAYLDRNNIVYDQEATAAWPVKGTNVKVTGNSWVIAKINGRWTAATHEWLRPGQKAKSRRSVHGDHIKRREFGPDWTPTVGEEYGFCVSGLCRDAKRNAKERTQIVTMIWK